MRKRRRADRQLIALSSDVIRKSAANGSEAIIRTEHQGRLMTPTRERRMDLNFKMRRWKRTVLVRAKM